MVVVDDGGGDGGGGDDAEYRSEERDSGSCRCSRLGVVCKDRLFERVTWW